MMYECPTCKSTTSVDAFPGEGYSSDIFECNLCGCEWLYEDNQVNILSKGKQVLKESS